MITKDLSQSDEINKATQILKNGGVIIFPTDTVYGIGCRYDNHQAIDRIRKIKGTPERQNFPILISNPQQAKSLTKIDDLAKNLISRFWPGALTIILKSVSSNQKIGIRMPNSQITKALIEKVGIPIIGTSANFHKDKAPTKFEDLNPELAKLADYVIEGKCDVGVESTVVDATINPPKILRHGAVKLRYIDITKKN